MKKLSTFEQSNQKNSSNGVQMGILGSGMALAKGSYVFKTLNYRTLTIAAGIIVAMLVFIALWFELDSASTSRLNHISLPQLSIPVAKEMVLETLQKVLL